MRCDTVSLLTCWRSSSMACGVASARSSRSPSSTSSTLTPSGGWQPQSLTTSPGEAPRVSLADSVLIQDAAFHVYARGAVDYRP